MFTGKNIVLGVTGGIAAYKSVFFLRLLVKSGANVQVIGTANSLNFIGKSTWESLSGKMALYNTFETGDPSKIGHIMLAQDVDAIVVAPATANIIAKAACGISDDLLSTVLMSATVPVLFAPGMNTAMYENPATSKNIETLSCRKNCFFVDPQTGELACKTVGKGRMAEPEDIFKKLSEILFPQHKTGIKWLITGGATKEYIDPIRYITNGSSGRTGLSIADEAHTSGGDVTFIGVNVDKPVGCKYEFIKTSTAFETASIVKNLVKNADIFVMSAAIADFSPVKSEHKIKKGDDSILLELRRTEDILKSTKSLMKTGAVRVGFAAETNDLVKNSLRKMSEKELDFIVANEITKDNNPFGSDRNTILILEKANSKNYDNISKAALGKIVVDKALGAYRNKMEFLNSAEDSLK